MSARPKVLFPKLNDQRGFIRYQSNLHLHLFGLLLGGSIATGAAVSLAQRFLSQTEQTVTILGKAKVVGATAYTEGSCGSKKCITPRGRGIALAVDTDKGVFSNSPNLLNEDAEQMQEALVIGNRYIIKTSSPSWLGGPVIRSVKAMP